MMTIVLDETKRFEIVSVEVNGKKGKGPPHTGLGTHDRTASVTLDLQVFTGGTPNHNCVRNPVTGQLVCV